MADVEEIAISGAIGKMNGCITTGIAAPLLGTRRLWDIATP